MNERELTQMRREEWRANIAIDDLRQKAIERLDRAECKKKACLWFLRIAAFVLVAAAIYWVRK